MHRYAAIAGSLEIGHFRMELFIPVSLIHEIDVKILIVNAIVGSKD